MVVVIECESCRSRFRVKKTLLKGAFAIRFRCRTCGGPIVVRNPEMPGNGPVPSPVPPVSPAPPIVPAQPSTYGEPAMSATGIIPLEEEVAPPEPAKPVPPGVLDPVVTRFEELVPYSPEDEAGLHRNAIGGAGAVRSVATGTHSNIPEGRARPIGTLPLIAGLGILLLAGGAYYFFGTSSSGGTPPGRESSLPGSSRAGESAAKPAYDVQDLKSFISRQAIAGKLFVITGSVKNVGKVQSGGIRVRATLIGKDNEVLMEQAAIAGNQIEENSLPYIMPKAIEAYLGQKGGEGIANRDIPPGKSLPFMVVCFDPPGKVEGFKVLATDAD